MMTQVDTRPASGLTDEEVRAIETFYRAFTDHDPALLDAACAPDWEDMQPLPGQGPGPGGLKPLITGLFLPAFPDLAVVVHEVVGSGGRAGVRASLTGTHRGALFGVAPTGRRVDVALYEFHHLQGGRLTRTWHLEDWFGMLNQVGAWPPAPADSVGAKL